MSSAEERCIILSMAVCWSIVVVKQRLRVLVGIVSILAKLPIVAGAAFVRTSQTSHAQISQSYS